MKPPFFLPVFATVLCCSCTSVKVDPRSIAHARPNGYQIQPTPQGNTLPVQRVQVSVPQPAPIRTKPGTSAPPYDTPSNNGRSPYDSPSGASSPLRHDVKDSPLYTR